MNTAELSYALQVEADMLKVELQRHRRDASNLQQAIAQHKSAEPPAWLRDLYDDELLQVGNLQSRIMLIERRRVS